MNAKCGPNFTTCTKFFNTVVCQLDTGAVNKECVRLVSNYLLNFSLLIGQGIGCPFHNGKQGCRVPQVLWRKSKLKNACKFFIAYVQILSKLSKVDSLPLSQPYLPTPSGRSFTKRTNNIRKWSVFFSTLASFSNFVFDSNYYKYRLEKKQFIEWNAQVKLSSGVPCNFHHFNSETEASAVPSKGRCRLVHNRRKGS